MKNQLPAFASFAISTRYGAAWVRLTELNVEITGLGSMGRPRRSLGHLILSYEAFDHLARSVSKSISANRRRLRKQVQSTINNHRSAIL